MAEAPPKPGFGMLGQKVGPAPLWVWMAGGIGAWYFLFRNKSGNANPAATQSQTGYGTDPAGNLGYIDPQSGYVYGSAEDIASLQQQGNVAQNVPAGVAEGNDTAGGTTTPPAGGGITPPPAQVGRYNAPTGLKVSGATPTTVSVEWNTGSPRPASYTVATYQLNGKRVGYQTVSVPDAASGKESATISGLHAKYQYKIEVWANGGKTAPPHATIAASTK
jgi:hypothetical protein